MGPKTVRASSSNAGTKRSTKRPPSTASKARKAGPKPTPTEHKPKPSTPGEKKKKPPHLRYTEKELKVPQLNGIRPAGVRKPPNAKKGKTFVDDKESMNAIMAMVMAEKEGNIESKMVRARQMEEVREARRVEAEKRAQSKKQGFEERKEELKKGGKKRQKSDSQLSETQNDSNMPVKQVRPKKKRVSFG